MPCPILRWRWQLFNQAGREVLDFEATSLCDLAGAVQTANPASR